MHRTRLGTELAACGILFWLGACGANDQGMSGAEREEAQDLTLDISGRYVEDTAAGLPAKLTIVNETGRHDVSALLELRGGLNPSDRVRLGDALRANDATLAASDVDQIIGNLETVLLSQRLGEGQTFPLRGGENVAFDRSGDVSEVALRRSVGGAAHSQSSSYDLTLSLYMTAHKGTNRLEYQTTPFTDSQGKGASGMKGLLLTLVRTPTAGGVSTNVATDLALTLGALVKY